MTTDETNDLPPSPDSDPGAGDDSSDVSPNVSPAQLVRAMLATQQTCDALERFLAEAHTSHRLMSRQQALEPAQTFLAAYATLAQIWAHFAEQVSAESARVGEMYGRSITSDVSKGDPDGAEQRALAEAAAMLLEHWAIGQQVAACLEDMRTRSLALIATYQQEVRP